MKKDFNKKDEFKICELLHIAPKKMKPSEIIEVKPEIGILYLKTQKEVFSCGSWYSRIKKHLDLITATEIKLNKGDLIDYDFIAKLKFISIGRIINPISVVYKKKSK